MSQEKVLFEIDKEGNLRFEYQGKTGPACVDEIRKITMHLGAHSVIDEGHTDDYYRPSVATEVSRWINQ